MVAGQAVGVRRARRGTPSASPQCDRPPTRGIPTGPACFWRAHSPQRSRAGSKGAPSPGPQRPLAGPAAPPRRAHSAPSPGPQRPLAGPAAPPRRARSAPSPGPQRSRAGSKGAPSPGPQRLCQARSAPAPGSGGALAGSTAHPPAHGAPARSKAAPPPGPRRRPRPVQGGAPVAPKTPSPSLARPKTPSPSPAGPEPPSLPPAPPPSARGRPLPPARRPRSPARLGLSSRPRTRTSDMTRVIAGLAGGRRLAVPPGTGTRPTSDRAREGLFSTWESLLGGPLAGERVLDLYAGSGAIGLEALSRGAGHTLLVEADARAVRVIKENVRGIGLPGAEVRAGKAEQVVRTGPPARPYDIVFLDPPYAVSDDDLREILLTLRTGGWLAAEALVTVERSTRGGDFGWPDGFAPLRARRYGEGTFWYGHAASTCDAAR
ncbi:16S rRNA (guanine(966)-N(2))-methyltransferase RsmD [Streptomyces griseoviridis]|uniref:16S rRNA (guanine(966)-N(2))-methyltransferase RsmD n=1 Tax=Streptomyces griseoviridis TaxID=45398 RepID=UPI00344C02B9